MTFYHRKMEKKAKELASRFPVLAILGPRQSGKTTIARQIFPQYRYYSLENFDVREFARSDPRGFLSTIEHNEGVILDEVQHVPELLSYIQTIVDESKSPGKFILTGSQNFLLNEKISQSLAGRVAILTLLPLSLSEMHEARLLPSNYEKLLFEGCYPRVYSEKISPNDWYLNYIQTYIEKDIRQIKNVSDLNLFQRFVKLCAGRIGQIVNWSDLGRDAGISNNTAKSWISLLESSYIIFLLQPHFKNFNKRLIKSPKLYFYDTGLAAHLLNLESEKQIENFYLKGNLFESLMISDFLKQRLHQGYSPHFYFWRDQQGHEIDLLFERDQDTYSFELKSSKTLANDFFNDLIYWQKISQFPPENSFLIYGGKENQKRSVGNVKGWENAMDIFYR